MNPYIKPAAKHNIENASTGNFFFENIPPIAPAVPHAIICHGVHGPWPRKIFETKAEMVPIKKPV